jgi:uncharacterized membrane protein YbhN (UPF0104 family)
VGSKGMHNGAADEQGTVVSTRLGRAQNVAIFACKLAVTAGCFWYIFKQVDPIATLSNLVQLDVRWAAFAILVVVLQIPIIGLRWRNVLLGLRACDGSMTRTAITAIAAIGMFFSQVLPSVASEALRAWLLVRLGATWRCSVTSLVIDRGVGVGLLVAMSFGILLLPSALAALGGYRELVLTAYGVLLAAGVVALSLTPWVVQYLASWRGVRWIATLVRDADRVLLGPRCPVIIVLGCLSHGLAIVVVWSLARAQGLALSLPDAAVLFTVMMGVLLVPVSVSGWGVRELATVSLLANYGVASETALAFSVCFGLVNALASLPGALVWLLYSHTPQSVFTAYNLDAPSNGSGNKFEPCSGQ